MIQLINLSINKPTIKGFAKEAITPTHQPNIVSELDVRNKPNIITGNTHNADHKYNTKNHIKNTTIANIDNPELIVNHI